MKKLIQKILPVVDIILMPFVYPAAWLIENIRRVRVHKLAFCKNALISVGDFPFATITKNFSLITENQTQIFFKTGICTE